MRAGFPKMTKKEPKRLPDIIRQIRLCKTQEEVRKFIKQECALIRASFRAETSVHSTDQANYRRRNIVKMLYIHMLGYPTHFAQIECLNLLQMDSFVEKRVGYLGLTILLDGNSKVLMMATNVLANDLSHNNEYIVCLALTALATLGSQDTMFRECMQAIGKCMMSENCQIRKKAFTCGLRAVKCGLKEEAVRFFKACASIVTKNSTDHGSLIAAVQLLLELVKNKPSLRKKCLRDLRGDLIRHLRNLTTQSRAYEIGHDVNGVNDPFLHVYILRLLGILSVAQGGEKTSQQEDLTEKLVELLPVVATHVSNTHEGFTKNPQLAVQAEIAQTILNAQLPSTLVTLALNTMGHWLKSNKSNPNVKYIALKTMQKLVKNTNHIQRHRKTILECLGDQDPSIRYRALDLVPYIVDDDTRTEVVNTLVTCLTAPEEAFHEKVVEEITKALKKAPDEETIMKMLDVLQQVKSVPVPEVVWHILHRIQNCDPGLRKQTMQKIWEILNKDAERVYVHKKPLMEVILWCLGEYGSQLSDHQDKVVELIAHILRKCLSGETQSIAVMALAKLWNTYPSCREKINATIKLYTDNRVLDLQCRSVECTALLNAQHDSIIGDILDAMPAYDMDKDQSEESEEEGKDDSDDLGSEDDQEGSSSSDSSSSESSEAEKRKRKKKRKEKQKKKEKKGPPPPKNEDLLLPGPGTTPQKPQAGGDDLFSMLNTSAAPSQPAANSGGDDLLDLLGMAPPTGAPAAASGGAAPDLLADLLGGGSQPPAANPAPAPAPVPAAASAPPAQTVYDKHGVSISYAKQPTQRPNLTHIIATFTNQNSSSVEGFSMRIAVPKYIQLKLQNPSTTVLGPMGSASQSGTQEFKLLNNSDRATVVKIQVQGTIDGKSHTETEQVPL